MRSSYVAHSKLVMHGVPEPIAYTIVQRTLYRIPVFEAMRIIDFTDPASRKWHRLFGSNDRAIEWIIDKIGEIHRSDIVNQLMQVKYFIVGIGKTIGRNDTSCIMALDQTDANSLNDKMSSVQRYKWINIRGYDDIIKFIRKMLHQGLMIGIGGTTWYVQKRTMS